MTGAVPQGRPEVARAGVSPPLVSPIPAVHLAVPPANLSVRTHPCHNGQHLALAALWLACCGLGSHAAAPHPATPAPAERAESTVRIRYEWGGGPPQAWNGLLEIDTGQLREAISLGIEADEPGTIWSDGRAVWIERRTARVYDGFDVTATGPIAAKLTLTLQSVGASRARERIVFSLADVCQGEQSLTLAGGGKLVARRCPGDALQLQIDRPHLVFRPGEELPMRVVCNSLPMAGRGRDVQLQWTLQTARGGAVLKRGSTILAKPDEGSPAAATVVLTLPEEEGVYDVHVRLGSRWSWRESATAQVVVVADTRPPSTALPAGGPAADRQEGETPGGALRLTVVDAFAPHTAPLHRRVRPPGRLHVWNNTLRRLLRLSGEAELPAEGADGGDGGGGLMWEAYRLQIGQPGVPHRLSVFLPAGTAQSVGISLLEPNAAGQLMPVGLDSGVVISSADSDSVNVEVPKTRSSAMAGARVDAGAAPFRADAAALTASVGQTASAAVPDEAPLVEHALLFWPKVHDPILLLHNFESGEPVRVDRVVVSRWQSTGVSGLSVVSAESASPSEDRGQATSDNAGAGATGRPARGRDECCKLAARAAAGGPSRLIGPYWHKPLLPEHFGAPQVLDAPARRSLDDWVTFYLAGRRLVEYLEAAEFNSALIAVLSDGSTIYPSRLLQPTPRYDTGAFLSAGQDPLRKDVLELLYRLFDRAGLALVPELQFATPLPALEKLLKTGGDESLGIELIGRDGRSWRESRSSWRGLAPYYNPLDPRVQQAVVEVLAELVERYREHPSFAAVAIELGGAGYLLFPSLEWGYDDATVARFEDATGVKTPETAGPQRFQQRYEFLTGEARRVWIDWRCAELARFYRRLAETLTRRHPTARLILAGNRVLHGPNDVELSYESLASPRRLEELLEQKGLKLAGADLPERLTWLRPALIDAAASETERSLHEAVNAHRALLFPKPSAEGSCVPHTGILFYHPPREFRVAGFDGLSPWQPAYTWLAAQPLPAPPENRRRFAQMLATADAEMIFDGGWTAPFGHEEETRGLRRVLKQLPAAPLHTSLHSQQPVIVRMGRDGNTSVLCLVNESPAPVEVRLQLSGPAELAGCSLADGQPLKLPFASLDWGNEKERGTEKPGLPAAGAATRLEVALEPYDVWGCRLTPASAPKGEQLRIEEVQVIPSAAALQILEQRITQFREKLQREIQNPRSETRSVISNFELLAPAAPQRHGHPRDSTELAHAVHWEFDHENPRSGKASLLAASQCENATVLSSPLRLEQCRGLAISAWLRTDQPRVDVRLVFEARSKGRRHTQQVAVAVDRNWRRYQLHLGHLPPGPLDEPRLRVEMSAPGKVWIDDVEVRTWQLTPGELRQLTMVYSAVTLAWDEKRYADCWRLCQSYWGRLLFSTADSGTK